MTDIGSGWRRDLEVSEILRTLQSASVPKDFITFRIQQKSVQTLDQISTNLRIKAQWGVVKGLISPLVLSN